MGYTNSIGGMQKIIPRNEGVVMYLDPGFGSMVVQAILASIAGLAAVFYLLKNRISGFFKKNKATPEKKPINANDPAGQDDA